MVRIGGHRYRNIPNSMSSVTLSVYVQLYSHLSLEFVQENILFRKRFVCGESLWIPAMCNIKEMGQRNNKNDNKIKKRELTNLICRYVCTVSRFVSITWRFEPNWIRLIRQSVNFNHRSVSTQLGPAQNIIWQILCDFVHTDQIQIPTYS